jgi:hypothetical protein
MPNDRLIGSIARPKREHESRGIPTSPSLGRQPLEGRRPEEGSHPYLAMTAHVKVDRERGLATGLDTCISKATMATASSRRPTRACPRCGRRRKSARRMGRSPPAANPLPVACSSGYHTAIGNGLDGVPSTPIAPLASPEGSVRRCGDFFLLPATKTIPQAPQGIGPCRPKGNFLSVHTAKRSTEVFS